MTDDKPAAPQGTPPAEVDIDSALVYALLKEQFPDLSGLSLSPPMSGWDNVTFRLGEKLAVRLPRRAAAAGLIENEQKWLPLLAPRLPLPVPAPLRLGSPGRGYPWRWSVAPWLPGSASGATALGKEQAAALARFFNALHKPAPPGAPANPFRGVPLRTRAGIVEERLRRLEIRTPLITPSVRAAWRKALEAPESGEPVWIHGDPHPCNFLAENGTLTGVIDWGDMAAGDPATDLAAFWMLIDDKEVRREALGLCEGAGRAVRARAAGWAVSFASILLETGLKDDPKFALAGERTFRNLSGDPAGTLP